MTGDTGKTPEPIQKKVDESWKTSVHHETENKPSEPAATTPVQPDFLGHVSALAMQVLLSLGEIPNPQTGQAAKDLKAGQYWIDTLQMLSDKTHGNLTAEESQELETLLYELRLKFVQKKSEIVS